VFPLLMRSLSISSSALLAPQIHNHLNCPAQFQALQCKQLTAICCYICLLFIYCKYKSIIANLIALQISHNSVMILPFSSQLYCCDIWLKSNKHSLPYSVSSDFIRWAMKMYFCCAFTLKLDYVRNRSQDSVVGIATSYGLDDQGVGVWVPVGSRIFSSPNRLDRLWGPPNLLSNGYWGLFPQG
jgi:hypothetical protein